MVKKVKNNDGSKKKSDQKTSQLKKNLLISGSILLVVVIVLGLFFYDMILEDKMTNPVVVLETSKGDITIELDNENAPITTKNFVGYVEDGFYDGLVFHRVIPNFMVQGGGFYKDGNQKTPKSPIKLESNNSLKNKRGTIAMARTMVPDSATSQFFINVEDNDALNYAANNPGYAVFGKVIEGMAVVDEIRYVKTASRGPHDDWPIEDVIIQKAYLK